MTWFLMGSFQDFQLSFQTNILQRKSMSRCKVASFFHESKGGFDRTFFGIQKKSPQDATM